MNHLIALHRKNISVLYMGAMAKIACLASVSERVSLHRIHWDHLHRHCDRHAYEADDDAGDPLREGERGCVRETAEELYDYELEDDSATEDSGEHVVV